MRGRVRRWLGASALALMVGLSVSGCSGSQQDDEGLDASDNQAAENDAGGDNNAASADDNAGNATANANGASDDGSGGGDGGGGDGATADSGGGGDGGGGTENDLQEIITEMNGQNGSSGDGSAAAGGDGQALPQDGAAGGNAAAPANAPANNTAAAAPANAPANNAAAAAPANAPANNAAAPAANNSANAAAPAANNSANAAAAAPQSTPLPFQPGGSPAAQGLPEIGSKMSYIVEKGDTLAKISQKIYGTNNRWQELATLSGIANPSRIFPGDLVYYTLDDSAVAFAKAYDSIQRSEEQVKQGDTLATIAQRLYGTTTAWRTLWRHNDKIDNPDVVTPGTTVYYIPKGAATAAVHKVKAELKKIASANHNHKHVSVSQNTLKHASKAHSKIARNLIHSNVIQMAGGQLSNSLVSLISNS